MVEDPDEQEEKAEVFNTDYCSLTLKIRLFRSNLIVMQRRIMKIRMMVEIYVYRYY